MDNGQQMMREQQAQPVTIHTDTHATLNESVQGNSVSQIHMTRPQPPPAPPVLTEAQMAQRNRISFKDEFAKMTDDALFMEQALKAANSYAGPDFVPFNSVSELLTQIVDWESDDFRFDLEELSDPALRINISALKGVVMLLFYWDSIKVMDPCPPDVLRGDSLEGLQEIFRYNKLNQEADAVRRLSTLKSQNLPLDTGREEREQAYEMLAGTRTKIHFSRFVSTTTDPMVDYYRARSVHWHFSNANNGLGRDPQGQTRSESEITYPIGLEAEIESINEHIEGDKVTIDIFARMTGDNSKTERLRGKFADLIHQFAESRDF